MVCKHFRQLPAWFSFVMFVRKPVINTFVHALSDFELNLQLSCFGNAMKIECVIKQSFIYLNHFICTSRVILSLWMLQLTKYTVHIKIHLCISFTYDLFSWRPWQNTVHLTFFAKQLHRFVSHLPLQLQMLSMLSGISFRFFLGSMRPKFSSSFGLGSSKWMDLYTSRASLWMYAFICTACRGKGVNTRVTTNILLKTKLIKSFTLCCRSHTSPPLHQELTC